MISHQHQLSLPSSTINIMAYNQIQTGRDPRACGLAQWHCCLQSSSWALYRSYATKQGHNQQ